MESVGRHSTLVLAQPLWPDADDAERASPESGEDREEVERGAEEGEVLETRNELVGATGEGLYDEDR
jgi:hypothetical protein